MKPRLHQRFSWVLLATLIFLGCQPARDNSPQVAMKNHSPNRIELRYQDSSVPPRYHRSYTISATETEVSIVVDVYGTQIADSSHKMAEGAWANLLEKAGQLQKPGSYESSATGTHAHTIQLFEESEAVYQLYWDSSKDSKVNDNTKALVTAMEAAIPDFPLCLQKGKMVKRPDRP